MSSIVIAGDTSGSVTLQAPAVAGSTTVNLPSTLGNAGASAFATTDSSGNLGLGVTPSAWASYKAFQFGPAVADGAIASAGNDTNYATNCYFNSGWKYQSTGYAPVRYVQTSGVHQWYTAASGTAGNAITFTQAMTLDASGNLGIGTSSPNPTYKLTVSGAGSGTLGGLALIDTDAYSFSLYSASSALVFRDITNSAERMRLDSSGSLLVGKTVTGGSTAGFEVKKVDATTTTLLVTTAGYYNAIFNRQTDDGDSILFQRQNSVVGSISVTTTATAYNTSSDYRLKNITGALTGYKERLMSLLPKQGTWIVDGSEFRGFVAHDFANPYPKSVTGEKDAVDADGNPIMQAMQASSSEVMADLVAMMKDLVAENESLKARLDAANL